MAPFRDPAGIVGSVVAVLQDVTEPLRVSAELERSQSRLFSAKAASAAPAAFIESEHRVDWPDGTR